MHLYKRFHYTSDKEATMIAKEFSGGSKKKILT